MPADLLKGLPEIRGYELKGKDIGLVTLRDIILHTPDSWVWLNIMIQATNIFHASVSLIPCIER